MSEVPFTLHGKLSELQVLARETERFCRENALPDEVLFDLNLALDELFTNALRHGGCLGSDGAARIRLWMGGDGVRVEYEDRGGPFDPLGAPEPHGRTSLGGGQAGGLGIHLVKQLLDGLTYERLDRWNRITGTRKVEAK